MVNNCLLAGVGGQGTVLASKLIALAAMRGGKNVRTSETIGMAQRGGCVVSHVRLGDEIFSPIVPKGCADVLIGFEPAEALRCIGWLKPGGVAVVNTRAVKPVTAALSGEDYSGYDMIEHLRKKNIRLVEVDGDEVCRECGSAKVLNIALLAAAANTGELGITVDELKNAVLERVPQRFHEMNLKAIDYICGEI